MSAALVCVLVLAGPATGQVIQITAADCARLTVHEPRGDVTFEPGVDVHGRSVTPADVGGSTQIRVPDSFSIPITVDLAERLGIPPAGDADFTATAQIGVVDVRSDGRAFFNGQPLQSEAAHSLSLLCQRAANNP